MVASCDIVRLSLGTPAGVGANADEVFASTACHFADIAGNLTTMQAAVVEATWDAPQATVVTYRLAIRSDCEPPLTDVQADCELAAVGGTSSPLRVDLDAATLATEGEHNLRAYIGGDGILVQHPFIVYISIFPDSLPPADYSAIPV